MEFKERISKSPKDLGISALCGELIVCPDLWELDTGDFAAIGKDVSQELKDKLPSDVNVGPDERIILLPRKIITSAKPNIPIE